MYNLHKAIERLAEQFVAGFPAEKPVQRTVGREAEFPIVFTDGTTADARRVLERLRATSNFAAHYDHASPHLIVGVDGPGYHFALEVGVGTIEINTRPCRDLFEIEALVTEAVQRVVRSAGYYSWRVLGYGIQPVTPPTLQIMAPKQRYQSLYRAMGASWLWYTVTASDQCHVAVGQPELVQMLNVGNMMAPVLIALCANSPIYGNKLTPFCSAREGQMANIHAQEHRHGMPARPYTSIADYVHTVSQSTYLILKAGGEIIPSHRPFTEYLREHGPILMLFFITNTIFGTVRGYAAPTAQLKYALPASNLGRNRWQRRRSRSVCWKQRRRSMSIYNKVLAQPIGLICKPITNRRSAMAWPHRNHCPIFSRPWSEWQTRGFKRVGSAKNGCWHPFITGCCVVKIQHSVRARYISLMGCRAC
ncbi:MAG: glutamate-cysteine ligase family protein [Caldilineaceae bacterium]